VLAQQLAAEPAAGVVEVLERLVEQQRPRPVEQRPGPAQPLEHPRRQRPRRAVVRQPHPVEKRGGALGLHPPQPGEELEVLERGQRLVEGEVGSQVPNPPPPLGRRQRPAVLGEPDVAGVGRQKARQTPQQGALARAVGPGHQQQLATPRLARHTVEHHQPPEPPLDTRKMQADRVGSGGAGGGGGGLGRHGGWIIRATTLRNPGER
jgi:hypothetical protein